MTLPSFSHCLFSHGSDVLCLIRIWYDNCITFFAEVYTPLEVWTFSEVHTPLVHNQRLLLGSHIWSTPEFKTIYYLLKSIFKRRLCILKPFQTNFLFLISAFLLSIKHDFHSFSSEYLNVFEDFANMYIEVKYLWEQGLSI